MQINFHDFAFLFSPSVYSRKVMYPPTPKMKMAAKEARMETCVILFHLATERSSMAEYSRKELWWHMNAGEGFVVEVA